MGINCYLLIHWQTTTYDLKLHLLLIELVLCVQRDAKASFVRSAQAPLQVPHCVCESNRSQCLGHLNISPAISADAEQCRC